MWREVSGGGRRRILAERPSFGAPFLEAAIEQRSLIAMAQVIQRKVGAGGRQHGGIAIENDPGIVGDAGGFEHLLEVRDWRQLIQNAAPVDYQLRQPHEARAGDVPRIVGRPVRGDVQDHDLRVALVLGQPVGGDQHIRPRGGAGQGGNCQKSSKTLC